MSTRLPPISHTELASEQSSVSTVPSSSLNPSVYAPPPPSSIHSYPQSHHAHSTSVGGHSLPHFMESTMSSNMASSQHQQLFHQQHPLYAAHYQQVYQQQQLMLEQQEASNFHQQPHQMMTPPPQSYLDSSLYPQYHPSYQTAPSHHPSSVAYSSQTHPTYSPYGFYPYGYPTPVDFHLHDGSSSTHSHQHSSTCHRVHGKCASVEAASSQQIPAKPKLIPRHVNTLPNFSYSNILFSVPVRSPLAWNMIQNHHYTHYETQATDYEEQNQPVYPTNTHSTTSIQSHTTTASAATAAAHTIPSYLITNPQFQRPYYSPELETNPMSSKDWKEKREKMAKDFLYKYHAPPHKENSVFARNQPIRQRLMQSKSLLRNGPKLRQLEDWFFEQEEWQRQMQASEGQQQQQQQQDEWNSQPLPIHEKKHVEEKSNEQEEQRPATSL